MGPEMMLQDGGSSQNDLTAKCEFGGNPGIQLAIEAGKC